jgi:hypothetical protein
MPLCISKPGLRIQLGRDLRGSWSLGTLPRGLYGNISQGLPVTQPALQQLGPSLSSTRFFSVPTGERFRAFLTSLRLQIYQMPTREKLKVENKADKR